MRRYRLRGAVVPLLLTASLLLGGTAWLMAVPPGLSFDEGAHYVKALGVGAGNLYGERPELSALERLIDAGPADEDALRVVSRYARKPAQRWQRRTTRVFSVPLRLAGPPPACVVLAEDTTGDCLDAGLPPGGPTASYTGTYQPYAYFPPGVVAHTADNFEDALRLARAVNLLLSLGLLVAAVWLLWEPRSGAGAMLGLVAAITPMVLLVSSGLSPSGPEMAAAVCFAAALLRILREEEVAPPWAWIAVGASGAVLCGARALGPAFAAVIVAAVVLLAGPSRAWSRARAAWPLALAAGAVVAASATAGLVWESSRQPRPTPAGDGLQAAIGPAIEGLPRVLRQAIGLFVDTAMPSIGYWLWVALVAALVLAGFAAGNRGDRLRLSALIAGVIFVTVVMALGYREIGPLQGRYALPVLVLVPLCAGELVRRRHERLPAGALRALAAGGLACAAAVHLLAWWASGRRFSVSEQGPWLFPFEDGWAPPLGWAPWVTLAVLASLTMAVAGGMIIVQGSDRAKDRASSSV